MGAQGTGRAEERIRRVQRLQVAVVAAVAVASIVGVVVVSLGIVNTGSARAEAERAGHALLEIRARIVDGRSDYWRGRAGGSGPELPRELKASFVEGSALLTGVMAERADVPAERAAIGEVEAAAAQLGGLVLSDTSSIVPGSAADRRWVAQADAAIARAQAAIDGWVAVLDAEIARRERADDALIVRLLILLGALIATLIGSGVLLWAATERARRAAVDEIAAERDATAAVVGSVQDGVAVLDANGVVVEANARLAQLIGTDSSQLVGRAAPWARALPDGYVGEQDITVVSRDGREHPVLITSSALPDDHAAGGFVHILKDMTERARAARELQERAAEQEALRRVATVVASGAEPAEVFDLVAREVALLLGAQSGVVTRFDTLGERAVDVGVWVNPHSGVDRPPARVPLDGDGPIARVWRFGERVRVDDLHAVDPTSAAGFAHAGYRAAVAAPVMVGAQRWGAVAAYGTAGARLADGAEDRLHRFAELVGLTVANADARARLASQAATDPLTGLANHRSFQERLEAEVERARAEDGELALVIIDLDRFKDVNDAFGHQIGDDVLAEAARRLAGEARFGELVARIGGEEFAWIMPGSDGINAWRAAERARRAVAGSAFPGDVGYVTASAGVADLSQAADAQTLVRLADGALYWAKASGRNLTLRYSPEVVRELSATERADRLARGQAVTALRALARAVDAKDPSTARHAERVTAVAVRLAAELGWSADRLRRLEEAALLHDVGKIGVADAVLFKPERLSPEERVEVEHHAHLGAEIVSDVLGPDQVSWIRGHHERWDGAGYPDGLAGAEIPEGARIIAVADAWDAMTSVRVYGAPRSPEAALAEVERCSGTQFCPDAARAARSLWDDGRMTITTGADAAGSVAG